MGIIKPNLGCERLNLVALDTAGAVMPNLSQLDMPPSSRQVKYLKKCLFLMVSRTK